jgi:hypothetical protein
VKHAVLADTGPLYAADDKGETHHRRALKQIEELADDGWHILLPYPMLLEAYSPVLSRPGGQAALAWLDQSSAAFLVNPRADDYAQRSPSYERWLIRKFAYSTQPSQLDRCASS